MSITHQKVNAIPDDPVAEAAGEVVPSDWNAAHTVSLADGDIPASIARDAEVTAAVAAEATLARNADNLASGTVADARIAATIARDSEVTTAVAGEATARDAAIATHAGLSDPHPGYLTPAEGNAAYDAAGAAAAVSAAAVLDGDTAGGQLAGTYPNPSVAASHSGSAHHDPVTVGTGLDLTGQLIDLDLSEVAAGGELGGFMDAPTVDATHSGSTHAAAQAAAEATAAADVDAHEAASDPHTGYRLESADHSHASTGAQGGTVAHTALTSVGANDHHAQTHATAHQPSGADAMAVDAAQATGSLRTITTSAAQAVGTAAAGNGVAAASSNHVHATGAGTPSTQAFGDAAATGSGPAAAMTDHKHAMPANPVSVPVGEGLGLTTENKTLGAATSNDLLDITLEDDDALDWHKTATAALTGTVAKTNGNATLVGTGTAFLTECAVGTILSVPGGATEILAVKSIESDTSLTLWVAPGNTSSGQTATRTRKYFVIPAGKTGVYLFTLSATVGFEATPTHLAGVSFSQQTDPVTATNLVTCYTTPNANSNGHVSAISRRRTFTAGDIYMMRAQNNNDGTVACQAILTLTRVA